MLSTIDNGNDCITLGASKYIVPSDIDYTSLSNNDYVVLCASDCVVFWDSDCVVPWGSHCALLVDIRLCSS